MSYSIWPITLPQQPLVDGFQEIPPSNKIATAGDTGKTRLRRRTTGAPRKFKMRYRMTPEQFQTFNDFHDFTLASGSLPFQHIHPRDFETGLTGFGSALRFSPYRQGFVEIPDHNDLSFSNVFTIEFWLKAADPLSEIAVISKMEVTGHEYQITKDAGGNVLFFQAYDGSFAPVYNDVVNGVIPDNMWHHWAWACDGTDSKVYRDGVLIGTTSKSGSDMSGTSNVLRIGRGSTGTYRYTDGLIDEVRIWSDERSAVEIAANMDAPLVGNETGLVALYQFEEGGGIVASDSTSGNHDGVIYNASFVPTIMNFQIIGEPEYRAIDNGIAYEVDLTLEEVA